MTLRDDLERVQKLNAIGEKTGDFTKASIYALNLIQDHDKSLLSAVRDSKRYAWLMENATIEAPFGAVSMKTIPPDNGLHAKLLWDGAIDAAMEVSDAQ